MALARLLAVFFNSWAQVLNLSFLVLQHTGMLMYAQVLLAAAGSHIYSVRICTNLTHPSCALTPTVAQRQLLSRWQGFVAQHLRRHK